MNLEHIYRAWRYRLKLDPNEIRFLMQTLHKGETVVDIGAYKGAYTYWMRWSVGKNGKVIVFEPQKTLVDYLKSQYQNYPNVIIENRAVSNDESGADLYLPADRVSPSASFNSQHEDIQKSSQSQHYRVQRIQLDSYVLINKIENISFIKCDVEGHELEVFMGAKNILTHQRPILLFECENRHQKQHNIRSVFSYLQQLNYQGYFFLENTLKPVEDFDEKKYQSDFKGIYINNFIFKSV